MPEPPPLVTAPVPVPLMIAPAIISVAFPFVSIVAVTPLLMAIFRVAPVVWVLAPNCNVPFPVKVRFVAAAPGTAPKAASALMFKVPPLITVPPE